MGEPACRCRRNLRRRGAEANAGAWDMQGNLRGEDKMEMTRDEVDQLTGLAVVEFGATWCGYCRTTRGTVDSLVRRHPNVRHYWIEDGPGRSLGRSFQVKLWPTFVFLRDGTVVEHLVRPSSDQLRDAFTQLATETSPARSGE